MIFIKLLFIRHGDPDYEADSLTEKGWSEARLLAQRMAQTPIQAFYVSPLGRAKDTASFTLEQKKQQAEELPWLQEFHAPIPDFHTGEPRLPWDQLPEDWTTEPKYYDKAHWSKTLPMLQGHVEEEVKRVQQGLDQILHKHGYQRDQNFYRAVLPNENTLAFFCHFGVSCVMVGHLLGISPMILWHNFCALPTSVTTLATEERRSGIASFRMLSFGDTAHLYAAGESPAFAGRFCETFANTAQRHD